VKRTIDATGDRDNLLLAGACAGLAVVGVGGVWVCEHLGAVLTGRTRPTSDPLRLVVDVARGRQPWGLTEWLVAGGLAVVLLVLVFAVVLVWPKRGRRMRSDLSARHMGRGRDVSHLTAAGSERTARRLGTVGAGLPLGLAVAGRRMLHTSWEDMAILVAGPRTQKTTAYAIPAVLTAPGACLATSNKRDLVDATAALRGQRGRVWVFDPQNIAERPASWWWNPLSYVTTETRADRLAAQLVTSARPAGAKTDAYFDSEAENLLSLLLLAAACDHRPITDVYSWLTRPRSEEPADVLNAAGYVLQYQALYALSHLPDKQMQGVYGTARALTGWLRNREVAPWVTPGHGIEFLPEQFARSTDTLYPLSREGTGSVGPLVAAMTMAVLDALEESATAAGGRLPVPFVGVLDEAANICRIRGLDAYYSHFGSRGIVLLTVLQSWAQGAEAWGDKGMEKLWSSANARIYGGGVDDPAFLRRLSDLIGTAERLHRSSSVGGGRRTITRTVQERPILTPAELRELPQGRAVVFASGTPAILTQPVPWWQGQHADEIRAALAAA
jgi:type IV secretory pathway TraG/TraD family ATPase VirD4